MDDFFLRTQRLSLRPPQTSDAAAVAALAGDFRIADVSRSIPHPYPPELAVNWIESCRQQWAAGTSACFIVVDTASGAVVGSMSLKDIERGEAEVGYWIGVPYWSQGYASEACNALVDYAWRSLRLRRLHASHLVRNPQSGRVLFKAGFRHLGMSHSDCGRGTLEPVELYERVLGD